MSYTVTDDHGVETLETQAELFDALIMRGIPAVDALLTIGRLVQADLDVQETP